MDGCEVIETNTISNKTLELLLRGIDQGTKREYISDTKLSTTKSSFYHAKILITALTLQKGEFWDIILKVGGGDIILRGLLMLFDWRMWTINCVNDVNSKCEKTLAVKVEIVDELETCSD